MNRKFIFAAFIAVPLFFACSEVGSDGITGNDGKDGIDGADGSSCIVQTRSDDGFDVLCGVGEEKTKVGEIHNGATGADGQDGVDGEDGATGAQGSQGIPGIPGVGCELTDNGSTFTLTCGETEVSWAKALCGGTAYNPLIAACDARDGKIYAFVTIGGQVWMAENLNYNASGSKCYSNNTANCDKYGRLYDWATATTACPTGWHLPSDAEWTKLTDYVGGRSIAGTKLKASSGWNAYDGIPFGTDDYGFSALPGGYGSSGGSFYYVGNYGFWWSTTEDNASYAYSRGMNYYSEDVSSYNDAKDDYWFSVRCLRD